MNRDMSQQPVTINRTMVGAIGLVLLVAAGILTWMGGEGVQDMWAGACFKVGLVMSAFWLAMPAFTRNPDLGRASWATLLTGMAVALLVARVKVPPQMIVGAVSVFVVLVRILGPRRSPPTAPQRPKREF